MPRRPPRRHAPASRPPEGTRAFPLWAMACFFCSGAAGLLYEVAWSKQLSYLLGSTTHAAATVVAAFLGGLALGARVLGVPLARRPRGERVYAALECAVAVSGVALLPVLRLLDPWVGAAYQAWGGESAAFAAARLVGVFILLLPPAALMGATLPVLVARLEQERSGGALAGLYAINTFGAVAGSVAGGFVLLPALGLMGTTAGAAVLNLAAAAVALLAGSAATARQPRVAGAGDAVVLLPPVHRRVLLVLFAISGFAALAFQIAWVRLYGLVLGSSVYSFAGVIGLYLFGLAVGSAWLAPALVRRASLAAFGMLQAGIAAAGAMALWLFPLLPQQMYDLGARTGPDWPLLVVLQMGLVAEVILVPCILMGAVFPLAARLLQHRDGGHAAGFAYAVNTSGTIAGSLAAGFVLLPRIGVQGTHVAAVALCAAVAMIAGAMAARRHGLGRRSGAALAGLLLATASAAALAPHWNAVLMSAGTYRPFHARNLATAFAASGGQGEAVRTVAASQRVLYYRDGINASVLVATDAEGRRRWMRVGGKIDASTGDMATQVLLGLLPAALADSGARTLVVGHGSGFTAAAALAAGAGRTDIVELEPGVLEGSRLFHEPGRDPLDDPRVQVHLEDARTLLAYGRGRYGCIISEPSNPWIAGVNNLFTQEFYRSVRARLEPDGVFCQWIQMYELSPATFGSMVGAFLSVFPDAQMFCVWRSSDLLLIAAPAGRELSLARLSTAAARRSLAEAALDAPEQVAVHYSTPLRYLTPLTLQVPVNRDDRPYVEYRAPRDMVEVGRASASQDPFVARSIPFFSTAPVLPLFAQWPKPAWYFWRGLEQVRSGNPLQIPAVIAQARAAGYPAVADSLEAEARARPGPRR